MLSRITLVSANSGGQLGGRRRCVGGCFAAALAEKALGQMVGDGGFCANVGGQGEVVRKRGTREAAAEASGRGLWAAVPEARRDGRGGGRDVGEHRPGEQGERGQALASLRGRHQIRGDKGRW